MASSKKSNGGSICQIKVTLKGTEPPIWRRFQVGNDISLYKLHNILQVVMGWEGYHLYRFGVGGVDFGEPDPEFGDDMKSASAAKLNQLVRGEKTKFIYEYDFGDSWEHEILIEKILPPEEGVRYPVCLDGKRACPPEDCGGVWGYADLLETIQNPESEEYEEMMEWLGGEFDPEAFDLEAINQSLKHLK
jgi:hypothetical protein